MINVFKFSGLTDRLLNMLQDGVDYLTRLGQAVTELEAFCLQNGITAEANEIFANGSKQAFVAPKGVIKVTFNDEDATLDPVDMNEFLSSYDTAAKVFMTKREFDRSEDIFRILYNAGYVVVFAGSRIGYDISARLRDVYESEGLFYTDLSYLVTPYEGLLEVIVRCAMPDIDPSKLGLSKALKKRLKSHRNLTDVVIPESLQAAIQALPVKIIDEDVETTYMPRKIFMNNDEFWKVNPQLKRTKELYGVKFANALLKTVAVLDDGETLRIPKGAMKHKEWWRFGFRVTEVYGAGRTTYRSDELKFSLDGFPVMLINHPLIWDAINDRTKLLKKCFSNEVTVQDIDLLFNLDPDDLGLDIKEISKARKIREIADFYAHNEHLLQKPVSADWWMKVHQMRVLVAMLMDKHARTLTVKVPGRQGIGAWHPRCEDGYIYMADPIAEEATVGRYPITAVATLKVKPLSAIGMPKSPFIFMSKATAALFSGDFDSDIYHSTVKISDISYGEMAAIKDKAENLFRTFISGINKGKCPRGYVKNKNGTVSKDCVGFSNMSLAKEHSSSSANLGTFNKNTQAVVLQLMANYPQLPERTVMELTFAMMQFQQSAINSQGGMREDVIDHDNTPFGALAPRTRKLSTQDFWTFVDSLLKQYKLTYKKVDGIAKADVETPKAWEFDRKWLDRKTQTIQHRHWKDQLRTWADTFLVKGRFYDVAEAMFTSQCDGVNNIEWLAGIPGDARNHGIIVYKYEIIDDLVERCTLVDVTRGKYSLYDMNNQIHAIQQDYNLSEIESVLAWLVDVQAKEADLPYVANAFIKASNSDRFYSTRCLAAIRLSEIFQIAGMKRLKPDARMPKWAARLEQATDKKAEINAILGAFYEIGSIDTDCDRCINHLFGAIFR